MVRQVESDFQAARILHVLAGRPTSAASLPGLNLLRQAVGVAQHHDAVAGTSMQHVAFDYARRLAAGWTAAQTELRDSLSAMLTLPGGSAPPTEEFSTCVYLNISVCLATQQPDGTTGGDVVLVLFNPLARNRSELIQLPLPAAASTGGACANANAWHILDDSLAAVPTQLIPMNPSTPGFTNESSECALAFIAQIPHARISHTLFIELHWIAAS
jgi:hypothetical protein